jgi:hypothetical protein
MAENWWEMWTPPDTLKAKGIVLLDAALWVQYYGGEWEGLRDRGRRLMILARQYPRITSA